MKAEDYISKRVRLLNIEDWPYREDGGSLLAVGDEIDVLYTCCGYGEYEGTYWLYYLSKGQECIDMANQTILNDRCGVNSRNVEIVGESHSVASAECQCPTLIFGHHQGCFFYKEL